MRNAAILVVNFRGVATETIKNIVLAGIGKLIIWDGEDVVAEDLGAGFFFRDEDIGKKVRSFSCALLFLVPFLRQSTYPVSLLPPSPFYFYFPCPSFHARRAEFAYSHGMLQRVDAAKARIESLNPLVAVETMTSASALEREAFDALVQGVDLVCITDSDRDFLVSEFSFWASRDFARRRRALTHEVVPRIDTCERCVPKVEEAAVCRGDVWPSRLHLLRFAGP